MRITSNNKNYINMHKVCSLNNNSHLAIYTRNIYTYIYIVLQFGLFNKSLFFLIKEFILKINNINIKILLKTKLESRILSSTTYYMHDNLNVNIIIMISSS